MSILLYGCTTWTHTKRLEKKLDGYYSRILRAISPGGNTPQGTNYTATCFPSRKLSKLDEPEKQRRVHKWCTLMDPPPHMAEQKQDDQLEHAYSSYVRIRDVALKMNDREKWRERVRDIRASGTTWLLYIYIYIYICCWSNDRKVNILKWIGSQMNLKLAFRFLFLYIYILFYIFVVCSCFQLYDPLSGD